jgi:hypothetical protein
MRSDTFEKFADDLLKNIRTVLISKGIEYSSKIGDNDRFHSFIEGSSKTGLQAIDVLRCQKVKHTVSIDDIVNQWKGGESVSKEMLMEKFTDEINYTILLAAMLWEGFGYDEDNDDYTVR